MQPIDKLKKALSMAERVKNAIYFLEAVMAHSEGKIEFSEPESIKTMQDILSGMFKDMDTVVDDIGGYIQEAKP